MARIVWTASARRSFKEIVFYIRNDSLRYARSFAITVRHKLGRLTRFADSGRIVPEDPEGRYREIIVGRYRVIYLHNGDEVLIVAVIHGARDLERVLSDR